MESNHLPEKPRVSVAVKIAIRLGLFLLSAWFYTVDLFSSVSRRLLYTLKSLVSLLFRGKSIRALVAVALVLVSLASANYIFAPTIYGQQGPVQSNYGWLGSFFGVPNGVTVAGQNTIFTGTDECAALATALSNTLTNGVKLGGDFNVRGYTGNQVCQPASLNNLNAALQSVTGATRINLGCPLFLALPLQVSQAATVGSPPVGALALTPWDVLEGCNPASVADNQTTHIIACTFTNLSGQTTFTGCTTPATLEWTVTSVASTSSGATINDRAYIHVNAGGGGMSIVGGDPFWLDGGQLNQNALNVTGNYRACQLTSQVTIASYVYANPNITFATSTVHGLSAGSLVTISGYSGGNASLNGNFTVASITDTQHFVVNIGAGFGGTTAAATVQTGNTSILNDTKCPFNPTPTDVYAPISDGLVRVDLATLGAGNGTYDQNLTATWGAGCIQNPEVQFNVTGTAPTQQIIGVWVRHPGKCNSTPTLSASDPTGTVESAAPTFTAYTAQTAAGSNAGGNCPATCNLIIHQGIPLIEFVDNAGTNQSATMGSQLGHLIIDCRELADCIGFRNLGGNEHTKLYDINIAGSLYAGFEEYTKQTNGFDPIDSVRVIAGKLPNQAVPFTASGTGTITGTTTLTSTAGTGFFYGKNVSGNPACVYSAGTPILVDGIYNYITGCSAISATATFAASTDIAVTQSLTANTPVFFETTNTLPTATLNGITCSATNLNSVCPYTFQAGVPYYVSSFHLSGSIITVSLNPGCAAVTCVLTFSGAGTGVQTVFFANAIALGSALSNGAGHTYYVPGCNSSTIGAYGADGMGHGFSGITIDFSACTTGHNFPYTTGPPNPTFQLPNVGIQLNPYYFSTAVINAHTERSQIGLLCGAGAPCRGFKADTWFGEPNCYVNVVSFYQSRQCTGSEVANDFFSNSLTAIGTVQYNFLNIGTSFSSFYSFCDDNPVGPGGIAGPCDAFNTAHYAVEWTSIFTPPQTNTLIANVSSTTPFGNSAAGGNQHAAFVGTTTAASIGTTTLCSATTLNACGLPGTYHIHLTLTGAGTACSVVTAGSVAPTITYTDSFTTTHTAIAFPLFDQKTGTLTTAMNFNTALGTEGATGDMNVTTNGSVIQIATTETPCTTGTGTYTINATVSRLQ